MPNKLERALSRCSALAKQYRELVAAGVDISDVDDIFGELDGWLKWKEHPSPDIWEGPQGWYKEFTTFVIEGRAGGTCPAKVWLKDRFPASKRTELIDLARPETWKKRPSK